MESELIAQPRRRLCGTLNASHVQFWIKDDDQLRM